MTSKHAHASRKGKAVEQLIAAISVQGDSRKAEGGRFITPFHASSNRERALTKGVEGVTQHKVFPACGRLCVRAGDGGRGCFGRPAEYPLGSRGRGPAGP